MCTFPQRTVIQGVACIVLLLNLAGCTKEPEEPVPEREGFQLPDGFQVDTLYSPSAHDQGSWISMAVDPKGRLIVSSERGRMYRVMPPPIDSSGSEATVESLAVDIGFAHGMVWAFNSLYVVVSTTEGLGGHNTGLYRLQDLDQDDHFEKVSLLSSFEVEMPEHGPHGIILGPDSTSLYLIAGNHTDLPDNYISRISPNWAEDNLFPSIPDPGGHAVNRRAPGGWIARTDSNGTNWEILSVGLRNPYDLVFNANGDLFTFDADMEWDLGLPWYRPIRFCHVTSGSEFGWRTGTGKWPNHYLDSVPPVLEVGQGSPTGLVDPRGGRFPASFQNSLLLFDWAYGIIYKVILKPEGAGYRAQAETFLSGRPLPLVDGVIGKDGALYFVTGGRNLTSFLFRVYHSERTKPVDAPPFPAAAKLRRRIEKNHGPKRTIRTDSLLRYLDHEDRLIRYAARVALEHRPLSEWREDALALPGRRARVTAMAAMARTGSRSTLVPALGSLLQINLEAATPDLILDVLRTYSLLLGRLGRPSVQTERAIIEQLRPIFPYGETAVDRDIARLLVFLDDPAAVEILVGQLYREGIAEEEPGFISDEVIGKTEYAEQMQEMLRAGTSSLKVSYALTLSHADTGWTRQLRQRYFDWFAVAVQREGGPSYTAYLDRIRGRALADLSVEERTSIVLEQPEVQEEIPSAEGPGRDWSVKEIVSVVTRGSAKPRSYEQGFKMYQAALCYSCHAIAGRGGNLGPDLTKVWSRFTVSNIATAIVNPNDFVARRFARFIVKTRDGDQVGGLVVRRTEEGVTVRQNVFDMSDTVFVAHDSIATINASSLSIMPSGLLNTLNEEELLDLFAFMKAEGNPSHPVYSAFGK